MPLYSYYGEIMKKKILIALIIFIAIVIVGISIFLISNYKKDAKKVEAMMFELYSTGTCETGNGKVGIHDPSIVKAQDGTYYIFGSHGCAAKSTDLITWESVACGISDNNKMLVSSGKTLREEYSEPLSWTDAFQTINNYERENWQTNIWAADVIYNKSMGKYCYYGSSSVWGQTASVIWMATSDNIEGPYEYSNCIVYSDFNKMMGENKYIRANSMHYSFTNILNVLSKDEVENAPYFNENGEYNGAVYPNCIDPALIYDNDGNLWMSYGSYFGGVFLMPLCEETGLPDYEYMKNTDGFDNYFGKKIIMTTSANELSGEGPYITYDKETDYYYLFVSYSGLNSLGGYNIREYRSKNIEGPYLDAKGNSALDNLNTGVKLFSNYRFDCMEKAYLSGGHSSCLVTDDGEIFHIYHTRFNNGQENYESRVHQMVRTEDGWLTVLPFEYAGEKITQNTIDKNQLYGEYEFIVHGTETKKTDSWAYINNIITPTQTIILNPDFTISGDIVGTWSVKDNTNYITLKINNETYNGIICIQKDESENKTEKIVFSAMGVNEALWGVKK